MEFLANIEGPYKISVNGILADDRDKVLDMIQNMDNSFFQAHHSHPTKRIKITVERQEGVLELELGQDSERPKEFWVFYPKYDHTRVNKIARITTSLLERY